MKYFILLLLLLCFVCTYSYGADCNVENTECTFGFNESYRFGWTPNHTNDRVKGYRMYESNTSQTYELGKESAYFDEDLLLDDNICERTEGEGECTSPPILKSVTGDFYYIVTAVDHYGFESDISNEVIMHVDDIYVPLSKIENFTITGAQ